MVLDVSFDYDRNETASVGEDTNIHLWDSSWKIRERLSPVVVHPSGA
jgi:hypothetical protein